MAIGVTPGRTTTEYRLALAYMGVGFGFALLGIVLCSIYSLAWGGVAASSSGTLLAGVGLASYQRGRAEVKGKAAAARVHPARVGL